jgi:hypothetical protein
MTGHSTNFRALIILVSSLFLTACDTNSPPEAFNVRIIDNNGGSAEVGDTLTGLYGYVDDEGDKEGDSWFRWFRDGAVIGGATKSTYNIIASDANASLTFEAYPRAATGSGSGSAVISSGITVSNSVPNASSVSISDGNGGSAEMGDTLTGNYTYADIDSDSEGTGYEMVRPLVVLQNQPIIL